MSKWIFGILVVLAGLTVACGQSEEEQLAEERAKEEERRQGFHCLSPWDGNHDGLEALVRNHLNDPDSMETYSTVIGPVVNDEHRIKMEFGADNAFGGTVRHVAIGFVDHDSCEATLDFIE